MRNRLTLRPSLRAAIFVLVATAVPFALVTTASSDTASPPTVTKATVVGASPAQVDVVPNGPLSDLADGTTVTITISGPPGQFFGMDARLCKSGLNITFQNQFNPTQGGNCIDQPFSAQSDDFIEVSASPTNTMVTFDFRVGTGSRTFTALAGSTTITCDATHDCALWLKESVDTALVPSGSVFLHYDLKFGAGDPTTTTTSTTSVPSSTTTTSSSVPSTTTTSTAAVPSSTTTTPSSVPSSTTTTSSSVPSSSTSSTTTTAADPGGNSLGFTGAPIAHLLWSGWGLLVAGGLLVFVGLRHRSPARR